MDNLFVEFAAGMPTEGPTSYHVSQPKVGLLIDVVRGWPSSRAWISRDDGSKFDRLEEAVQAVLDVPTPNVPFGCPTPDEFGRCPGHRSS